jgi:hypothetical protein
MGPFRLDDWWTIMSKPQPGQVLENPIDELGAAAARVEVFDPQQEVAAAGACVGVAERRGKGVP